ncbi:ornithine cyclodeaminase family protein [Pseudodonghicola flavimaris]|uniref:Ornithine cyclodeaminase n=1 Tax=Pseudodonghicola flavimaris TaxID=3050036 RepID=A0ABT7F2K7_9RHOB|nr:ornithine cyclodeaminase [Pseudodonghicola flavimaris]MDK3018810.1 ornithine cyclodeaminase [Pseudodonghicola flavimaris]
MTAIPFRDFDEVHARAPWGRLIDALEEAHRREKPQSDQLRLMQPRADGQPDFLILAPAWDRDRALGVKLVTSFPENPARHGLTSVGSLYILFDPATGKPTTLLDGEAMIFRKTAADSALGARLLSQPDARRLVMMGAGALAPYVIDAIRHVRPGIDDIRIWNRSGHKAEALAESCRSRGLPAQACTDPASAQAEADIVMSATMAEEPIIHGDLLRPGTHVGLIGSFTPQMREGDDALLRRAMLYVDDPSAVEKSGEFTGPIGRGVITPTDVLGDLFDLCQGRCALPGPDDISLFKNGGASHLDLITAGVVMAADRS